MKTVEREQAGELRRREGRPIKEIAQMIGASVSSVGVWVRDIELTPEQHEALRQRNPAHNQLLNGRAVAAANRRRERVAAQESGRAFARRKEPTHVAGCMFYWAEGSKGRNQLRFSNSDPQMVRFFVSFLRRYFALDDAAIRITCHLFADHVERQREVKQFWLETSELPTSSLCKSVVNVYSRHSKRKV